ncbi:MAG: FAD binding domain-containing protein [Polyangiaceae bacterium]
MTLSLTVNGKPIELDGADLHQPLLHFLRARGLTGTKEGCAEGECGACAVVLLRKDAAGDARYVPINSCLLLLGSAVGQELLTVEGVAREDRLHPVQAALVESGGSQCGYCTPGFVMSMFAEYYRADRDGYDPEAISGNLCRCTGYRPIRDAARALGKPAADDPHLKRLTGPAPVTAPVSKADGKAFYRPARLEEALKLLSEQPGLTLISGGTDVVVDINQRNVSHTGFVSLENVQELQAFTLSADELCIGAAVTLSEIERRVHGKLPMFEQLLPLFSSRLIRNRATLGGNLGTASPIGDSPPALLALDAELRLQSVAGKRSVKVADYFLGYRKTVLQPGEIIVAIAIPLPAPPVQRFYKVSKRVLDDISTVAAGFSLRLDGSGKIRAARLAYGGVAATPMRALDVEAMLAGKAWDSAARDAACKELKSAFTPMTDHRGSADYRRAMVSQLFARFFHETTTAPAQQAAPLA